MKACVFSGRDRSWPSDGEKGEAAIHITVMSEKMHLFGILDIY